MPGFRVVNLIIQSVYLMGHLLFILRLYRNRQPTPVWKWFFVFSAALWLWVSGRFMETIVYLFLPENNDAYVFAANFQYIGDTVAVAAYVIWILCLSGFDALAESKAFRIFLFACPAVICILVFTNHLHHLFYTKLVMGEQVEHGVLFLPCLIWLYLILLAGYLVSIRMILHSGRETGKQLFMFSLFPALPAAATLIRSVSGVDRLDYTPLVMAVTILCLYQIVFRYRYVNIVSASVREVLNQTSHPIAVIDRAGNSIDYLNEKAWEPYGQPMKEYLHNSLPNIRGRQEGGFEGQSLIIDAAPLPEEGKTLIAVTDVTETAQQQGILDEQIQRLQELSAELEAAGRNIDAYLDSLYSTKDLGQKQELIESTYASTREMFEKVKANLQAAGENPEGAEPALRENLQLTEESIAAIRRVVAQLKEG